MEQKDIDYVIEAHRDYSRKDNNAFRKWDGKTPYYTHPLWCASMIATETSLDDETRKDGILALLYHDILEDTNRLLPEWLSDRVGYLVDQMTYHRGNMETPKDIWKQEPEIRLYKLYDIVNNLLDGSWMDEQKRTEFKAKAARLCNDVETLYGEINITRLAKSLLNGNLK